MTQILLLLLLLFLLATLVEPQDFFNDPDQCLNQYPAIAAVPQPGDGGFNLSFPLATTWTVNQEIQVDFGIPQTTCQAMMLGAFLEGQAPDRYGFDPSAMYHGSWVVWDASIIRVMCGFASDGTTFDTDGPNAALASSQSINTSVTNMVWQAPTTPGIGPITFALTAAVDATTFYFIEATLPEKLPPCFGNSCGPFGTCVNFTTCGCQPGYAGNTSCCPLGCSDNGVCNTTTNGTCLCNAGFAGIGCGTCSSDHYNYPQCIFCDAATTCSGHGHCDNTTGQCICDVGFNSTGCATQTSCGSVGATCVNGGMCVTVSVGVQRCDCLDHCTGTSCDTCDACAERCKNGATCTVFPGQPTLFQCHCPPLFTGIVCDQGLPNLCADPLLNPCRASQTCVATDQLRNLPGSFLCVPQPTVSALSVGIEHSLYNHSLLPSCSASFPTACVPGNAQLSLLEHVSALAAANPGNLLLVSQNQTLCWDAIDGSWAYVHLQLLNNNTNAMANCLWELSVGFNSPPDADMDIFSVITAAGTSHRLAVTGPGHQLMTSSATEVFVLHDAGSANSHTFSIASRPKPGFYVTAHPTTGTVTTEALMPSVWAAVSGSSLTALVRCLASQNLWTSCV